MRQQVNNRSRYRIVSMVYKAGLPFTLDVMFILNTSGNNVTVHSFSSLYCWVTVSLTYTSHLVLYSHLHVTGL